VKTASGETQGRWAVVSGLLPLTDKERRHLRITADRLRAQAPDLAWVESLEANVAAGEMLDAFASRNSRLQDTLADEFIPSMLRASLEPVGTQLDNLLRAEKLGWIESAEHWIALRTLRNRLVHEYIDSAGDLLHAERAALEGVDVLTDSQKRLAEAAHRLMSLSTSNIGAVRMTLPSRDIRRYRNSGPAADPPEGGKSGGRLGS
jgi:hypothetical protein